jgi:hypothetical protein
MPGFGRTGQERISEALEVSMSRMLVLLGLFAVGCAAKDGKDGDEEGADFEISDQNLQGTIAGSPFSFVAGETDDFLSDEDSFFATFYAEAYEACGFSSPQGDHLIVSVPTEVGTHNFTTSLNGTFVHGGSNNEVTFEGTVRVDEVTETEVSGGVYMVSGSDFEVDGNFTLTICPGDAQ